ncbi:AAA family ATPase [Mesorhizobium sp. CA15]|uniref:AAA family ATPase n=1 Tax=Mesorhizobium sp. CA15 TaxID=2876641 RepID=UPI001CD11CC7|nr:AAA family ATPase [Mesorhizobium sp. CA15]MBZ9867026.1 AAA family ATPase [Mesorhizobium sp. CA15]
MKLLTIRLDNVRRFTDPVEITGISTGLNVLSAPNESGKSTIFDALHALFFKGYRSWDKDIASLAPHAGGDPEAAVEIEIGDNRFKVEKRWSKTRKGEAQVFRDGHLMKQAEDAETWLAEVLKAPKEGGPAGLLWVRQGLTNLDEGEAAHSARRDLLSSVTGEVEAMTGGRRMDATRALCRRELDRYVTSSGKAKAGGPLKLAEDEVSTLDLQREGLAAKAASLSAELDRRRKLRRELSDLEDGDQNSARLARLAEAEAAHDEASRHAEALERAIETERSKCLEMERAQERLSTVEAALAEEKAAAAALDSAIADAALGEAQHREVEDAFAEAKRSFDKTVFSAETASDIYRRALRAQTCAATAERRAELVLRLTHAEGLRTELEKAVADTKIGPADNVLRRLENLAGEVRVLRKAREIESIALTMTYTVGRTDGVALDGRALPDRDRVAIPNGATLEIDGIGYLTVHPGAQSGADTLAIAEKALADALEASGYETSESARTAAQLRLEAASRRRDVEHQLNGTAPNGIEALREGLARLPEPGEAEPGFPDAKEAHEADVAARLALADATDKLEKARSALEIAQTRAARTAAATEGAAERVSRARSALLSFEDAEADKMRLTNGLVEHRTALAEAVRQREAAMAAAPDLEVAKAALQRARSVISRVEEDRQRIRVDLGKLDTAIGIHAAEAVEEELADVEIRLQAARRRLDEIMFEVSVLQSMAEALESARTAARDRYVEPVLRELTPLIRLLWPEAELRFDAEKVLPTALVRAGTEEDFGVLSGGTKEQIALLVRLAFARMLARSGNAAPVILDDAIVYTDDDRIERIFDVLTRQEKELQIIVFSCRQKAFRDLGGRGLTIVREEAVLDAAQ